MIEAESFILKGGRVIDPGRDVNEIMDIAVADGKIMSPDSVGDDAKQIDASGLIIAPGFIDMHVHLRQPGNTASEDIASGTAAAAAGGFTAVVVMPNTSPVADNTGAIDYLRRHAEKASAKVLPCGALTKGLEGKDMAGIGSLKAAGVIAVSDDGRCIQNNELMRRIVQYCKSFNLPVLDHCEENVMASDGVMHEGVWSTLLGMRGIPAAAEELIVARNILFAKLVDWKIHIQHVSTAGSVEMIRRAQRDGIPISAEVTPHHLTLIDENIKKFDTNYKMNPPLRSEEDRQALIAGLRDGTIAVIATDHAPHTETAKLVEFDYAPNGIIGLETAVPVCLTELYHPGVMTISELVARFTTGPAEVLGLNTATLASGAVADITILDLDKEFTIDKNEFRSKSRNTPFDGMQVKGKAAGTIVDGKFTHREF
jgi:dihydroorotase